MTSLLRRSIYVVALLWWICASDAEPDSLLEWLFTLSGEGQAYPLMDFVASDLDDIDAALGLSGHSTPPKGNLAAIERITGVAVRLQSLIAPDDEEEAMLADLLMHMDWHDLVYTGHAGIQALSELVALSSGQNSVRLCTAVQCPCDVWNSAEDQAYIASVHWSLDGLETLPLERNEFKWADFFMRFKFQKPFCILGVASLFLVAADITAYAAAAAGGEHATRLLRALRFAQTLARQYVAGAPPGARDASRLELLRTAWPLWPLLRSIAIELAAGKAGKAALSGLLGEGMEGTSARGRLHAGVPADTAEPGPSQLYLSVIIQCRNDNYGGGMLDRLNRMLLTTTWMFHSAGLPSEIIIVEWNPPANERPISEVIVRAPGTEETVPIRVIRVPPSFHMKLPHHKAHPIFEHIAENVGFRRARGKFVLKTNIDNIFSPDTVLFIARRELREDAVYRATYLEYDVEPPETSQSASELLDWLFSQPALLQDANLQLQELSAKYPDNAHLCRGKAAAAGADAGDAVGAGDHSTEAIVSHRSFYWPGSGDFVLVSRALVFKVCGYPQVSQNWQTDDLIHCRLRAAGVQQVVIQPPCVTVHQNHRRINRLRASTRWVITDANFQEICTSPFAPLPTETGRGRDWGFPDEVFEESRV